MYNLAVSADGVPVSGGGVFVGRLIAWLLGMDLLFFVIVAAGILIICWFVKFIITLKEDR
jgi:hypothetical protein